MFDSFALIVGKQIEANLIQKQAVALNINPVTSSQRARKHLTGKVITEPINLANSCNPYTSFAKEAGKPGEPIRLGEYEGTESTRSLAKGSI